MIVLPDRSVQSTSMGRTPVTDSDVIRPMSTNQAIPPFVVVNCWEETDIARHEGRLERAGGDADAPGFLENAPS